MATTLQNVIDRIRQDYLNRPTDLETETVRAVQAAVRHYERHRYPWTENGLTTLTTVTAVGTLSLPADFQILDGLELQYSGQNSDLRTSTYATIRRLNSVVAVSPGVPYHFALHGNYFHISPLPDSAYPVLCYYVQKLPVLAALTDTNDWLSAAEDVIVYHAAKLVWANILRNDAEANKMYALERTAATELAEYVAQRQNTSITPTKF